VDYPNGNTNEEADFLHARLGNRPVAIGDLMLTEILQGFRDDGGYRTARGLLLDLPVLNLVGTDVARAVPDN
jgi:hypothetical protein